MEVALIPPLCQLHTVLDRPFQMIIPEGLKWPAYQQAYLGIRGRFTILDNGMFESSMVSSEELIDTALKYHVNEIVMPDVRDNMEETLTAVDNFLNMFLKTNASELPIGLQIVLQVSNMGQVPDFVHLAGELEWKHFGHGRVFTYGIPRRIIEKCGDQARLAAADFISAIVPNPIHLLGYARTQSPIALFNETKVLASNSQVRSMDTDAPFIWTSFGDVMGEAHHQHHRMGKYLNLEPHLFPRELRDKNIDLLDEWATGARI